MSETTLGSLSRLGWGHRLALCCLTVVSLLVSVPAVAATPGVAEQRPVDSSPALAAQDTTLVVDDDGGGDYESISAALADASDGDTIRVRAGTYSGFRPTKNVTITTAGAVVEGAIRLSGTAVSPTIEGFTIRPSAEATSGVGVFADDSRGDWTLRDITTRNIEYHGISAIDTSGDWRVLDSDIRGGDITVVTTRSTGNWRIERTVIAGDELSVIGESGVIRRSTIVGTFDSAAVLRGEEPTDARRNYWGQPGGPRAGQCIGAVDCSDPLDSPPVSPSDPVTVPGDGDDGDGEDDTGSENVAPTAVVSVDQPTTEFSLTASVGETLRFDGSASADPDGEIHSYEWSVSGPATAQATGPRFDTSLPEPGTYTVTLTVSDGTATDTAGFTVDVSATSDSPPTAIPPVAAVSAPDSVATGETVQFSAAESVDPDGQLRGYDWDFDNDGTIEASTTGPTATYTFSEAGRYDATVTVVDDDGETATANTSVRAVSVTPPTPALSVSPTEGDRQVAGRGLTFDARASTASADREIVAYEWSFGDGTTRRVRARDGEPPRPTTTYTYDSAGSYVVTLTVVDSVGVAATTSRRVEVTSPPTPQIGPVSPEKPGRLIRGFDLENSYTVPVDAHNDIETVTATFPTGETIEATRASEAGEHTTWRLGDVDIDAVTESGLNTVAVRATDEQGHTGVETFTIGAFEPPGWFEFAMGNNPTVTRDEDGRWLLESSAPTVPPGGLVGPTYSFSPPVSQLSGEYALGLGAEYGFEYVFAQSRATASGHGRLSLTTPVEGLDLDADIGTGFGGSRSRTFSFDISGTARVTDNAQRAVFERGRVAFGTQASATVPVAGVAVYIPTLDTTVGVASVDLTLTKGFEPGVTLAVNDARTALAPESIELTQTVDLKVTAGAGSSVDFGFGRVGLEARGIVGSGAQFTTEVYPNVDLSDVTLSLRAGVRGCLGPCATEWLLNDEYPFRTDENSETTDAGS